MAPYRDGFSGEVGAVLRPEDIALALEKVEHISIQNQLPGEIVSIHEAGVRVLCVVRAGTDLLVEITRQALETLDLAPGTRVWCLFKARALQALETFEPSAQSTLARVHRVIEPILTAAVLKPQIQQKRLSVATKRSSCFP